MSIDQTELGRRLKQARESCGLTQEDVAREMGLARATIAQIELGNRSVSGLELAKFSYLYARDIREFLAPTFSADSLTSVLLRAEDGEEDGVRAALRDCIALGHQLRDLETLLGINRSTGSVASYPSVTLGSKWDAIQSGTQAASEERRRLGLGFGSLGDVPAFWKPKVSELASSRCRPAACPASRAGAEDGTDRGRSADLGGARPALPTSGGAHAQ